MTANAKECDYIQQRLIAAKVWGLLERIAAEHAVSPRSVIGRRRFEPIVLARHHFWYALETLGFSHRCIALMCRVDRATVIHGTRNYDHVVNARFATIAPDFPQVSAPVQPCAGTH